jgi:hypothetical protein
MHIFLASLAHQKMIYKADFSRLSLTMEKIIVEFVIFSVELAKDSFSKSLGLLWRDRGNAVEEREENVELQFWIMTDDF